MTFFNRRPASDARTGAILADGHPGAYSAWWDLDDWYPGYGFGRTSKEACDDLQANTEEWLRDGRPAI